MRTGTANLPLHGGKAPAWLFNRMKRLAREIILIMLSDLGSQELMKKISDPFWFQAFGCVLGFDWHSSGLTTTVCGAMKEAAKDISHETGFFIAGGKGKTSRKTPDEIQGYGKHLKCEPDSLVYASRMSAKVDSSAVQDGYQLYHHVFFFNRQGQWCVVQQGMDKDSHYARRYHWLSLEPVNFVCEPHSAVCSSVVNSNTLNLVALEAEENRKSSTLFASEHPDRIIKGVEKISSLDLPSRHSIIRTDINKKHLHKVMLQTYQTQPCDFESLLGIRGVGAKTLRALSLLSEIVYGAEASFRDPARFSYAHGGKDGYPYPVNRDVYDETINFMKEAVNRTKIGETDKRRSFRQLSLFVEEIKKTSNS